MTRPPVIRPARTADAAEISAVVVHTLLTSNAADDPPSVISRVTAGLEAGPIAATMSERLAVLAGLETLTLRSSLAARGFSLRRGFRLVGEAHFGDGRTIDMERGLAPMASSRWV